MPLTYVDDRSLACVVCVPEGGEAAGAEGTVVRWHLDDIPPRQQGRLLDTDAWTYAKSLVREASTYKSGLEGVRREAKEYHRSYTEKKRTAKPEVLRPFQLACQNVIIGLAAMRHDEVTNAHLVQYWQVCDVPHVATYEGCRALAVLTLCDAFQAGGTMELDFSRHPERQVPAALQRYGRTLGVELGEEIKGGTSVSPAEARELFLAVSPMPSDLRLRVEALADAGEVSIEALCYSLMSPIWRPIELDFLLACSGRAGSVLRGGAPLGDRGRAAEFEVGRAALIAGMFFQRLNGKDTAGPDIPDAERIFDDTTHGMEWSVLEEFGAVRLTGVPDGVLPWQRPASDNDLEIVDGGEVVVMPRANPVPADVDTLARLERRAGGAPVFGIVPAGAKTPDVGRFLYCPDPLRDLDARVAQNMLSAKLARS